MGRQPLPLFKLLFIFNRVLLLLLILLLSFHFHTILLALLILLKMLFLKANLAHYLAALLLVLWLPLDLSQLPKLIFAYSFPLLNCSCRK